MAKVKVRRPLLVWQSRGFACVSLWWGEVYPRDLGMGSENECEAQPLFILVIVFSSGTIDDCELVEGLVLTQKVANSGISRVEKAKIGLIQFCLSAPKTDVSKIQVGSCLLTFK